MFLGVCFCLCIAEEALGDQRRASDCCWGHIPGNAEGQSIPGEQAGEPEHGCVFTWLWASGSVTGKGSAACHSNTSPFELEMSFSKAPGFS